MPLVKIEDIKVSDDRFREDLGDLEELAESIKKYGLLHPIVVDDSLNLLAGFRRFTVMKQMEFPQIPITRLGDLDELERREVELEENIRRKQFTWPEEVKAKEEIDRIKRAKHGSAVKGHESEGWGIEDTAKVLHVSKGSVSMDLTLARAIDQHPELKKEPSKKKAYRKFLQMREHLLRTELAKRAVAKIRQNFLENIDCVEGMQKMESASVDLVVTDPPWGINVVKASMLNKHKFEGHVFSDHEQPSIALLGKAFREMYRVLKEDRHAYVFFAISLYQETLNALTTAGFDVDNVPLIWNKASASHPSMGQNFANCYEPIFHARKGRRDLASPGNNMLNFSRVPPQNKIHPTEKPVELMRYFIEQSSTPGELVLDPFAGSGAVLEAAIKMKRLCKGFEMDEDMCNKATMRIMECRGE